MDGKHLIGRALGVAALICLPAVVPALPANADPVVKGPERARCQHGVLVKVDTSFAVGELEVGSAGVAASFVVARREQQFERTIEGVANDRDGGVRHRPVAYSRRLQDTVVTAPAHARSS